MIDSHSSDLFFMMRDVYAVVMEVSNGNQQEADGHAKAKSFCLCPGSQESAVVDRLPFDCDDQGLNLAVHSARAEPTCDCRCRNFGGLDQA